MKTTLKDFTIIQARDGLIDPRAIIDAIGTHRKAQLSLMHIAATFMKKTDPKPFQFIQVLLEMGFAINEYDELLFDLKIAAEK